MSLASSDSTGTSGVSACSPCTMISCDFVSASVSGDWSALFVTSNCCPYTLRITSPARRASATTSESSLGSVDTLSSRRLKPELLQPGQFVGGIEHTAVAQRLEDLLRRFLGRMKDRLQV